MELMADEGIVSRAGMIQELFMVRDGLLCMSTDDFTQCHNDQGSLRISCVFKGSCKFAPLLMFAKVKKSHNE